MLASTLGGAILFIVRWCFSELAARGRALNYLTWAIAATVTFLIMASPWWIHGVPPIQIVWLMLAGAASGLCLAFFSELIE